MGLLDDAIREHLDLKRRRGADPTEVERAEREALGPVRRGPEAHDQLEPDLDRVEAYDHEDEQDWEDDLNEEHELPFEEEHDSEPAEAGPAAREDRAEPGLDTGSSGAEPHSPSPDHPDQETVEYKVEGAADEGHEHDDVLEETPDFLQDTPDHDRLWFEQRPPKDFDFDR